MKPTFINMVKSPHQLISMWFGLGLSPVAPGTVGSLGGFTLFLLLLPVPVVPKVGLYALIVVIASWASSKTGQDLGKKDHGSIVVDEVIGMSLVLEFARYLWLDWVAAFLLFRLFDVWKPWPVYLADRSPNGGFMVIFDDILASVWAIAALLIGYQLLGISSIY